MRSSVSLALVFVATTCAMAQASDSAVSAAPRPNILWITVEDMSPNLGCYGDEYATTPNLDRFARDAVRYTKAFATAPVCSPSRSCLITGVYATSLGTPRLRSAFPIPESFRGYPAYLREAGYFTTNNVKTDYNIANERAMIADCWDGCSAKAHWRDRPQGEPFFSIFNLLVTHQSRTSAWSFDEFERMISKQLLPTERHDPASVVVPAYYPDTPLVRRTLARYYDCITAMDKEVGDILAQLESDGLVEDTIVFFYSDHGAGMPRGKRTLYDSGLHVPLMIRFPKKFAHLAPAAAGETVDRLVSFVDFAPTMLSLTGRPIPEHMQGKPFLGSKSAEPRKFVFGARDRVDEAYDVSRSVRDGRYLYICNYMPHLAWHQPEAFSDTSDMRREITALRDAGKLNAEQLTYAGAPRPLEELYDTEADPYQVHNLAAMPEHADRLASMRARLREWILETRDLGFLTEEDQWRRSQGTTPYEMARSEDAYPLERILGTAELVGRPEALDEQVARLTDADPAVAFWAAVGLRAQEYLASPAREVLAAAMQQKSPSVAIEAAAALAALDSSSPAQQKAALETLVAHLEGEDGDVAVHAARALQLLGEKATAARPAMQRMLEKAQRQKGGDGWMYLRFSLGEALKDR